MPTVNIPPLARFVLYLIGALALLFVAYAVDKDWAGDAEVRLVTGVCALLNILAAAKTNLSDTDGPTAIGNAVADALDGTGRRAIRRGEHGSGDLRTILVVLAVLIVVIILVRAI